MSTHVACLLVKNPGMNIYKTFGLTLLLASALTVSAGAGESPKNVFQIPEYPGTEMSPMHSLGAKSFQFPFARILRVYRTKDNSPLDSTKVIVFFRDFLVSKGWKKGIYGPSDKEPYLGLQTQVFENLKDGTRVQAAGDFQLWVAPKDGMITVFLEQWRISSPDQKTREQVAKIVETLQGTAAALDYSNGKLRNFQDSGWEEPYNNEYLIERETLTLVDETVENKSDIDPAGRVEVSILTYKDEAVAKGEMNRQKSHGLVSPGDAILTIGKSVVLITDISYKQKTQIDKLVAQLEKLMKPTR